MPNYISKHLPSFLMGCVIAVSFLVFVFQLVSVNATRDAKSNAIRRIEKDCVKLKEEIKSLEALKDRQQNAALLERNPHLPEDFKEEISSDSIIRVRTMSTPYGTSRRASSLTPKALAIELNELALQSGR
ncbi:MAG: hypothetical protein IKM45_01740 [Opitutales bacterium]|nr:hypothetical protein [Opitutales bacterium]